MTFSEQDFFISNLYLAFLIVLLSIIPPSVSTYLHSESLRSLRYDQDSRNIPIVFAHFLDGAIEWQKSYRYCKQF